MNKKYQNTIKKIKEVDKNISIKKRIGDYLQYCKMFGINPNNATNLVAFYQEKVDMAYIGLPIE